MKVDEPETDPISNQHNNGIIRLLKQKDLRALIAHGTIPEYKDMSLDIIRDSMDTECLDTRVSSSHRDTVIYDTLFEVSVPGKETSVKLSGVRGSTH